MKAAHRGRRFCQYNKDGEESWGFGCTPGWKLTDQCGQLTEKMSNSKLFFVFAFEEKYFLF